MAKPDFDMQKMVPRGYRLLAQRGLRQYENLGRNRSQHMRRILASRPFRRFHACLERMEKDGKLKPEEIVEPAVEVRETIEGVLKGLKAAPQNVRGFIGFCFNVVSAAFRDDVTSILTRQGILPGIPFELGENPPLLYVLTGETKDDSGSSVKVKTIAGRFVINLDRPAIFALMNMKHLSGICLYDLQLEAEEAIRRVVEDESVTPVFDVVSGPHNGEHRELRQLYEHDTQDFHPLAFFTRKEAIALATTLGVDISRYLQTVSAAVPGVTFTFCLGAGSGIAKVFEGIDRISIFEGPVERIIKSLYRLMLLSHILPNSDRPGSIQGTGIPLSAYTAQHPDHIELIKGDTALQAQFMKTYFPNFVIPEEVFSA